MGVLTHKDHGLTEEILKHKYFVLRMSDAAIGKEHGITGEAVGYLRRVMGIKTLTQQDRISFNAKKAGLKDIYTLTKEELAELNEKCGQREIAKMYGCSRILIRELLKKYSIGSLTKTDRIVRSTPQELTDIQKQVLFGSLLGDGHVSESDNHLSARYKEFHCDKQKPYLEWKKDILFPYSKEIVEGDTEWEDGRIIKGWKFITCFHPVFLPFRKMFYRDDRSKKLPDCFEEAMTGLSLAMWYCDDGHLTESTKNGIFTIASNFIDEDTDRVVNFLNSKWGLNAESQKNKDSTLKIIKIRNIDGMFELIKKYIIPEMAIKIPLHLRFVLPCVNKENLINTMKQFRLDEWKNSNEIEKEAVLNDMFDYWMVKGFPYPEYNTKKRRVEFETVKNSTDKLEHFDENSNISSAGSGICNGFHKHIWTMKRKNKKSPMEVFKSKDLMKQALRNVIDSKGVVVDGFLRRELQTFGGVYNFKPVLAKQIYNTYCPAGGDVLDPCAGFGGRLFGFYASNCRSYTGIDANQDTVKGLKHMKCIFDRDIIEKDVEIYYDAFEDFVTEKRFDIIFTSPPYFCKEDYGNDEKQSGERYKTYDEWRDRFLKVLVDKSIGFLKVGGRLVLNVGNIKINDKEYKIEDDLKQYMSEKIGIEIEHRLKIGNSHGQTGKSEAIFVSKAKQ